MSSDGKEGKEQTEESNRSKTKDLDLKWVLDAWPFNDENNVRKITAEDGTKKIQVRVDQGAFQGILQMELDGRPDGRRPRGRRFVMDHYRAQLREHFAKSDSDDGYSLSESDCREIFDESFRIYERYIFLLQIQDYSQVIRDTERNMDLFRFVNRYAARESDRLHLEKWWPYILRIHAVARVMLELRKGDMDAALAIIRETVGKIRGLSEVEAAEFYNERKRSLEALAELAEQISEKRPLSPREMLERALDEAVEREDYERAAQIRDRIRTLSD